MSGHRVRHRSWDVGFRREDVLLYQAKTGGRNRVASEVNISRDTSLAGESA